MGVSHAGRRRSGRARPVGRPGARTTASLTALTLAAAVAVPVALVPDGSGERTTGRADQARQARVAARGAVKSAPDQIRQREWHLDAMHIPRAWKWSKGLGVTVAVLDTGVDKRHPDLVGRVTSGPDLTGGMRRPGGKYWGLHGTSMASIIAGHGNGPGFQRGVIGVAPQSRILSVRVTWENDDPLRGNGGTSGRNRDAVAQGIRYAVDHGADVINMSLGGGRLFYDGDKTEEEAVRYALSKGVVLIASAGNDGAGANRRNYPAAYSGVIAVGALDNRGRIWKDSNRRSYVAVCAPGVEIVSADASNGYVVGTGTSPSSAIAAGVAALVRARYPKLTPSEIRQALVQGSVPRRETSDSSSCPGMLDATRALLAANKINKAAHGPGAAPRNAVQSSPAAGVQPDEGTGTLVTAVVAGGAVLVIVGLVLGWRQRRRPDDDFEDDDYLRHSNGERPREPVGAMTGGGSSGGPDAGPVHVPLWQSGEVFPGGVPSAASPSPHQTDRPLWPPSGATAEGNGQGHGQEPAYGSGLAHPQASQYGSGSGSGYDQETPYGLGNGHQGRDQGDNDERAYGHDLGRGFGPVGRQRPPFSLGDLRPYQPDEAGVSDNGRGQNGSALNGFGTPHSQGQGHGHGLGLGLGHGLNGRSALNGDAMPSHEGAFSGPPAQDPVPRQEDDAESPTGTMPVLPLQDDFADERPTAALPAVPPAGLGDDDPYGGPFSEPGLPQDDQPEGRIRRQRPADDDDYRPPWW
ncbi:S8 family serine peptidase [Actinomadura fulvescens]|uniref:Peptidase S8/S53 domain-containing protein n=1 Tax=Actinomadura fulvescens TaxID=46160 RepID=A0ABP6CE00_9ACTN